MRKIEEIKETLADIEDRIEKLQDERMDLLTMDAVRNLKSSRDTLKWVLNESV